MMCGRRNVLVVRYILHVCLYNTIQKSSVYQSEKIGQARWTKTFLDGDKKVTSM